MWCYFSNRTTERTVGVGGDREVRGWGWTIFKKGGVGNIWGSSFIKSGGG